MAAYFQNYPSKIMANFNKTILLGRLTAPPETRQTPNGNSVATFRLASSRSRKNPQTGNYEDDPNPLFIDCEAWTSQYGTRIFDVVKNYCQQGTQILVTGQLRFDQWDDRETGQKRSKHKINVEDVQLLSQPGQSGQQGGQQGQGRPPGQNQGNGPPPQHRGGQQGGHGGYQPPPPDAYDSSGDIPF